MSGKEQDWMGYDPLEWLKEDNADNVVPESDARANHHDAEAASQESPSADMLVAGSETEAAESSIEETTAETTEETPDETADTTANNPAEIFDFGTSLQIMDVAQLKPRLEQALQLGLPLTLNADADLHIDGAGVQLLFAFVQQAREQGISLHWQEVPAALEEAATLLNAEAIILKN